MSTFVFHSFFFFIEIMISFWNATLDFFSHFESLKYIFNDNPLISLITIELLAATA